MTTPTWLRHSTACLVLAAALSFSGCNSQNSETASENHEKRALTSFSQEITSPTHDFTVKTGAVYSIDLNIKNTGTEPWITGAQPLLVDAGYRWRDDKGTILPIEGNRAMLTHPVMGPGQTDSVKLQVTAPPAPGSYTLVVSMVQEQVAWFFLQGAKPLEVKATVN